MDAKVQRWVQRHGWNCAVEHYQTFWRDQLRPAHDAVLAEARLEPGESVVEIACGTGMVTLPAAAAVGRHGRVVATDISERMVEDTARRARQRGHRQVEVLRCDAESLSEALAGREPFDAALCSLGLMYVPDPARAIAQTARTLRPGGRVVVAVWGERRNCGWASIFPIIDSRVASDVCPMFFALGVPGGLARVAEQAGLSDVTERRIDCELVYDDDAAALGAAFLGGPVALAYSRFDADTKASAAVDYLESIAPFRDGAGYRIPGQFVIVAARRTAAGFADAEPAHTEHHHHMEEHLT